MDLLENYAFEEFARQRGWAYDNGGQYRNEYWEWYSGPTADIVLLRQPPDRVALVQYDELTPREIWSGHVSTSEDFDKLLMKFGRDLIAEVDRFRTWAASDPHAGQHGNWESDYDSWPRLRCVLLLFIGVRPFASWSESELRSVLYSIARDNQLQYLASEIGKRHPELILPLGRASLQLGERDDRWQLAVELGHFRDKADVEQILLEMARDKHEYVRRMAMKSLLDVRSPAVEDIAVASWTRPDEAQEWARMMALYCLNELASVHLEPLLADAERDPRLHLREYAQRIRRGKSID